MNSLHDIPGSHFVRAYVPQVAAGSDKKFAIGRAPFDCTLVAARKIFDTNVTGVDTNSFTAKVLDGGANGLGTTLMASKAYPNGVNAVALTPELLTNEAAANLNLDEGDVIVYLSDQAGSGLIDRAGIIEIEFKAR